MTNGQFINMLIDHAKEYAPQAIESVIRNIHMNNLKQDTVLDKDITDALIVDFINFIGQKHCMDVGLYAKELNKKSLAQPKIDIHLTTTELPTLRRTTPQQNNEINKKKPY